MALHSTEAFVLRTYSLAEADKICVFLTREMGKVRGVAHGARKLRSRFGSSLEPFTEVALTYYQKEGRELVSVSNCDIVNSHFDRAARDVETAGAFSYMAELLVEFLPDHEANERLYRLVRAVLEAIEEQSDTRRALRYFECWLLRLVGFFPDLSMCPGCGERIRDEDSTFLTAEGAPRCVACSSQRGSEVTPGLREAIGRILKLHPTGLARDQISPEHVALIGEINYQIIRHALERDLRSREALGHRGRY
jgi:DNA repair protein RecO (recombination protein O)